MLIQGRTATALWFLTSVIGTTASIISLCVSILAIWK
jgi:hypothetical protein